MDASMPSIFVGNHGANQPSSEAVDFAAPAYPPSFRVSAPTFGDIHGFAAPVHMNGSQVNRTPPVSSDFIEVDDGDVLCHDPKVNQHGEALCAFIRSQASIPPKVRLTCSGTHTEIRTRTVIRRENDIDVPYTETYTETVTDFSFILDLTPYLLQEENGAPIWIVGDREPAFRGQVNLQVDNTLLPPDAKPKDLEKQPVGGIIPRRKAMDSEEASYRDRKDRRRNAGLPPWALLSGEERGTEAALDSDGERRAFIGAAHSPDQGYDDVDLRPPTQTLLGWANNYCKSARLLKDFKFRKEVYGWDYGNLKYAILGVLRANSSSQTTCFVEILVTGRKVHVQPYNKLSRMLSTTWVLVLLWLTLIYPLIIWPFKRFSPYGGGQWRVAGSAFAFTKWVHLPDSIPGETPLDYLARVGKPPDAPELRASPYGIQRVVGLRSGQWFAQWKDTIALHARQHRVNYTTPLSRPLTGRELLTGVVLDGYPVQQ